jgi:non-specific serine/threonine protein kinase
MLVCSALVALANQDPATATRYLREALPPRSALGDTVGIAQAIELLGRAATAIGDYERSARLTGAAHRIWRELGRTGFGTRLYREWVKDANERTRGNLGQHAYEAAYQQGWAFSIDDAIAYALGTQPVPGPPPDAPPAGSPLTRREQQVAELIAEGLSNKRIAARLVVSRRTAESHTENILRKLGFTSRTQVATWVIQRGTGPSV